MKHQNKKKTHAIKLEIIVWYLINGKNRTWILKFFLVFWLLWGMSNLFETRDGRKLKIVKLISTSTSLTCPLFSFEMCTRKSRSYEGSITDLQNKMTKQR